MTIKEEKAEAPISTTQMKRIDLRMMTLLANRNQQSKALVLNSPISKKKKKSEEKIDNRNEIKRMISTRAFLLAGRTPLPFF